MEQNLKKIYRKSAKDITKKWTQYMEREDKRLSALRESGDLKEYQKALGEYTLQNQYYKDMVDTTTERLAHINEVSLAYINDQLPEIYEINYNQAVKTADQVGVSFSLINESVVKRMVKDGNIELPEKRMNIPADKRWNTKQLNSSVLQGILQGESMDKIANRIYPIVSRNESAAIRNARTMVTGAENRGRLDSYKQLEEDGLVLKKVWMATPDGRTRDWHIDMDGQEVNLDENFVDGLGNELEYPGDPGGAPETVYNCRCTMVTDVVGFRRSDGSVNTIDYEPEGETLHEQQMKTEVSKREDKKVEEKPAHTVVNGKDISETWTRRPDQFNFEIEDVINAQGFDGLPQVVSAEEFERYVSENNIICMRGYTAPNEEVLKQYQEKLYNGEWYVDCSKGGAAFGQGMYTAGNFGNELSEQMKREAKGYGGSGTGIVETLTLDHPNLINHDDLNAERWKAQYEIYKDAIGVSLTEDQDILLRLMCNAPSSKEEAEKAWGLLSTNQDDVRFVTEEKAKVSEDKKVSELINRTLTMNDGTFAAMRGYDAIQVDINTKGDKYFVVLNRTKCVFKGE